MSLLLRYSSRWLCTLWRCTRVYHCQVRQNRVDERWLIGRSNNHSAPFHILLRMNLVDLNWYNLVASVVMAEHGWTSRLKQLELRAH